MAAMLHARNNTILFLWDKMFILMQNIFIVPGMQHGRHAKPLYSYFEKSCRQKSTQVHAARPKGSMCRCIELLHVLNTNEI